MAIALAVVAFSAFAGPLSARPQSPPDGLLVRGELWVGPVRADSGTVVLHQVSAAFSGGIDTVAVAADGSFELRLPAASGVGGEVFFGAVWRDGVLYYGDALSGDFATDSAYVIRAYPAAPAGTAPRPVVAVRNLILERAGPAGGWAARDVFEVESLAQATIVSSERGAAWSHALPGGATDLRTGGQGFAATSATLARGRVEVSEPVPPGGALFFFRYRIPSDEARVPLEGVTGSMELLLPTGDPAAAVEGLAAAGEAELNGVLYRRFAGRGLAPGVVTVRTGSSKGGWGDARLAAALAALVLTAAGTAIAARRGSSAAGDGVGRRGLIVAVAELDEAAEAGELGADEHRRRRRALLERLGG